MEKQTQINVPNLFSLAPLSLRTTMVRINYDDSLLHPQYPKPQFNWLIVDASRLNLKLIVEDAALHIIPNKAESVYLDVTKLPTSFMTTLNTVIDYYKDPKTKETLEKRLNDQSYIKSGYKGTF